MMSIRSKLSLWLTALVILGTILGMLLFESMLRQAFHDSIINRLQEDLEHVIMATEIKDGQISINESKLSSFYTPVFSGRYFQLNLGDEEIRSRSLWDQQLNIKPLAKGEVRVWQARGPKKHDMQLLSVGLTSNKAYHSGTLTVAQDLSIGRQVFSEIYGTKLLINLAMLLTMICGIFLVLRQSFRPINKIKQALTRLRNGDSQTLELEGIPPELLPLATTYNELLDYTSNQIERSRHNLGNLSHGLKTPLAVMQQQVEVLGLTDPQTAEALTQQLELIRHMIERKLAVARITGNMLPAAQMNIPKDIDSLTMTLAKVYHYKAIECELQLSADITRLPIHREDGMELVGNLLDNAFKWANTKVIIEITMLSSQVRISITDDGKGVDTQQLALLTQRGKRLDESVMGHGLGLSIVKEICEQYDIGLQFTHGETLPGLQVNLLMNLS
ncbi:MAG: ATP-binding protein [Shewanella sp.]|uniref:ATP-binding protein n=1 Tax=Shewanella sp. SNU WT4 TaxID=2590015 RepID=UPI00112E289E|nr:ATP-binding protein [Shewanella sp. SNU WT4]QDF66087.1 GHKL domain-containing protein [Shewanella sp. SNU WT4]